MGSTQGKLFLAPRLRLRPVLRLPFPLQPAPGTPPTPLTGTLEQEQEQGQGGSKGGVQGQEQPHHHALWGLPDVQWSLPSRTVDPPERHLPSPSLAQP